MWKKRCAVLHLLAVSSAPHSWALPTAFCGCRMDYWAVIGFLVLVPRSWVERLPGCSLEAVSGHHKPGIWGFVFGRVKAYRLSGLGQALYNFVFKFLQL